MSSKIFVTAVIILVAAALAAVAWFALGAHGNPRAAAQNIMLAFDQNGLGRDVAYGGAQPAPDSDSQDLAMFDFSLEKVEEVYYKPVDVASLVHGEQQGIDAYLKSNKIVADLPAASGQLDETSGDDVLKGAFAKYGSKVSDSDLTYAAISGMLSSLGDPYTVFLDPRDTQSLSELIAGGDFGGIGVYIGQDAKTLDTVIIEPIVGTPAKQAGLQAGDIIQTVDGHQVRGMKLDPVMNLIRGPAGSVVHLIVKRPNVNAPMTFAVTREVIHVPSVQYSMIGPDKNIGYVQLFDFGETTASEVDAALTKLSGEGAKAYVLDLRNNGGGLLRAAVDVSSKFISDGPIVSIIDRQGKIETDDADGDAIQPHPLVVLVNQFTASASEITSGAIQDTKVGTLIGVKTFGKGVVQTIYDLPGESAIKITTARYVTPAGRDINKKGIQPDFVVPMDPRLVGFPGKDVQMNAALSYVEKQLAVATH